MSHPLNLDLNVIKAEGLKVLCKYPWEQLQQLILSINGVI
jgi:hypothetical protein